MTETMMKPEVIGALGPYFWIFALLVIACLTTIVIVVRHFLKFLGNHMSENVAINGRIAEGLGHVCETMARVETRVSECPERRPQ